MTKRFAKYAVVIYVIQALVGFGVGVYLGITLSLTEIERMVSGVAH